MSYFLTKASQASQFAADATPTDASASASSSSSAGNGTANGTTFWSYVAMVVVASTLATVVTHFIMQYLPPPKRR